MAQWGIKDDKTSTGTIAIDAAGAVTGTTTDFAAEAAVGNYIESGGEYYLITEISSATAATVVAGVPGATLTAVSAGANYTLSERPNFVTNSESAGSGSGKHGDPTKVFGVDTTEVGITDTTHSGWVRRTTGTGGRSGRTHFEVLVAMGQTASDMSDADDDTEIPDSE